MNKILFVSFQLLAFSAHLTARADGCDACNAALGVVRNTTIKNSKVTNDEAIHSMFNHDYDFWEKYKASSERTIETEAGYSVFSATFNQMTSTSEAREKFQAMKSKYEFDKKLSSSDYQYLFQSTTDPKNLNLWLQCMVNTCGEGPFLESSRTTDVDFTVHLGWRIKNALAAGQEGVAVTVVPQNCKLVSGDLETGVLFSPRLPRIGGYQKLDKKQPASVSIKVEGIAEKFSVTIPVEEEKSKEGDLLNNTLPVGTVIAYAGRSIPKGWLLCNGDRKNSSDFPALYNAIGTEWGAGDGSPGDFNLPEMRGMFLRGVDGADVNNDPDRDARVDPRNHLVKKGNKVGSFQMDATKTITRQKGSKSVAVKGSGGNSSAYNVEEVTTQTAENLTTGNETRPKNVSVYFIIKH